MHEIAGTAQGWEHLPHDADIGVRGFGPTLAAAFEQGAIALTAVVTDPAKVAAKTPVAIECAASDPELLFVEWLNALVYEMATRNMLFAKFEVSLDGNRLAATAWGEEIDPVRHEPAAEVKGATYTGLKVARGADGRWSAECIVDV
jgi:tRNA nucleotidyltransferase (CCA-adding enzyme)